MITKTAPGQGGAGAGQRIMNMHAAGRLLAAERIEIVEDAVRLGEIDAAWDDLWQRAGGLVFQSHGWIDA